MPLEGVRMPVDQAGDEQAIGQADDVGALARAGRVDDRRDPPVCELDGQARAHGAAGLEHEVGNEQRAGHDSMGRSMPRSRAVVRASS